jgi:hypothetical protein
MGWGQMHAVASRASMASRIGDGEASSPRRLAGLLRSHAATRPRRRKTPRKAATNPLFLRYGVFWMWFCPRFLPIVPRIRRQALCLSVPNGLLIKLPATSRVTNQHTPVHHRGEKESMNNISRDGTLGILSPMSRSMSISIGS